MEAMTLATVSNNFMYAATAVFGLAMLGHAAEHAFTRERRTAPTAEPAVVVGEPGGASVRTAPPTGANEPPQPERGALYGRIGTAMMVAATFLLGCGVVTRGIAAERVPWSNLYEFTTTGTLLVCVAYLLTRRHYRLEWLSLPVTGLALVLVVVSVTALYTPVAGLVPSLQSYWLAVHVSAACIAAAVFTLGAVASTLQLIRARAERKAVDGVPVGGYLGRMPPAAVVERISYRLHAFAFPVWTFALITGAIWAREAWGRYWGWDPKEVWMFITWVAYAAFLHARATAGWRAKAPWVALVGYAALLFNLIGVNLLLEGLHSYA